MTFPAAPTELGTSKIHFLTTDGNAAGGWFSVYNANTTTGANPVGFAGVATHIEGDPVAESGGLPGGSVPLVLVGGDDGANAVPLQVDGSAFLKVILQANSGVDIGDVDVASLPALAAGANAIGKLAANSGVDIGDVDVTSILPGVGAANLGKTEDESHTSGDVGVMMLGVENEDQAALSGGDKDYTPIAVTPEGNVIVKQEGSIAVDSHAVTNAGTFAVQSTLQAGSAAFGKLAANTGVIIGEVEIGAATFAAGDLAKREDDPAASGDVGVMVLARRQDAVAISTDTDNDYSVLSVDNDGRLYVNIADGSNAITVDAAAASFGAAVEGELAHDAPDASAKPIKLGGRAQSPTAQPDEVADNDRVDALFDRNGYLHVRGDMNPLYAAFNGVNTNGNNTIIASAGAGKKIAVWAIMLIAEGTVETRWEDGAAGTAFTGQMSLQAREGYAISGGMQPLFIGSAATLLNLELNAAVECSGFVSYSVIDD